MTSFEEYRRLTDVPGYDAEGRFSRDGKRIVFTSQRDGDLEIYVMDTNGALPTARATMADRSSRPAEAPYFTAATGATTQR